MWDPAPGIHPEGCPSAQRECRPRVHRSPRRPDSLRPESGGLGAGMCHNWRLMVFRDLLGSSLRLTCAAALLLGGCVISSSDDDGGGEGTDDNPTSGGPGGDDQPDGGVGTDGDGDSGDDGDDDGVEPNPPCGDNVLQDGGFEEGTPSAAWSEASAVFGTPICDASCTEDPGATPLEGMWWVWFGGVEEPDLASVSQTFSVAGGTAELQFYFDINASGAAGSDLYTVHIDDVVVFMATDAEMDAYDGYTEVIIDISEFADGAEHTLSISGDMTGDGLTNFFTDNVSIAACTGTVDESDDTPDTGMTDDVGTDTVADTMAETDSGSTTDPTTGGSTDTGGSTGGSSSSGTAG